jgi:hypothetical protein
MPDNRSLALFRIGLSLSNVLMGATAMEFLPAKGSIDLTGTSIRWPQRGC